MKRIVLFLAYAAFTMACQCAQEPPDEAFCGAHTVSHVKVTSYYNPHHDNTGMKEVYYGVEHIEIFKKPNSTATLPSSVGTRSHEATCGITMGVGKEYLLSGYLQGDGRLHAYLCGQVSDNGGSGVTEWEKISVELRTNLTLFQC